MDPNSNNSDDSNPFIAFRHLVDQQFASAIKRLNEQAGIHENSAKNQRASSAPDDSESRLFGIFSQPPLFDRAMTRSRNEELGRQPAEQDQQSQQQQETDTSRSSWWGRRHEGCQRYRHGRHGRHRRDNEVARADEERPMSEEGFKNMVFPSTSFDFWRITSPYSPEHLVADPALPESMRQRWYVAFLELMAEHNDESKGTGRKLSMRSTTMDMAEAQKQFYESSDKKNLQWHAGHPFGGDNEPFSLLSMLVGPTVFERPASDQRSGRWTQAREKHAGEASGEHETEEDVYRWFLGQQNGNSSQQHDRSTTQRQSLPPLVSDQAAAEDVVRLVKNAQQASQLEQVAAKSDIISTVTQLHTVVNPDGSSRTVRRFKKTFADGKEECSEDVSEQPSATTQHHPHQHRHIFGSPHHQQTSVLQQVKQQQQLVVPPKPERKSSGWFWS